MKSMNIAASSELYLEFPLLSRWWRWEILILRTAANPAITAAQSRSGILRVAKRTGFHLPVFLYSQHAVELPAGVTGAINGTAVTAGPGWNPQPVSMEENLVMLPMTR